MRFTVSGRDFFYRLFCLEIPGNLIMTKVGARIWIARILITWGIVSGLTAFVSTPIQFYVVRFFLGVAEASFFPGIIYYLGTWCRREDQAKAVAFLCDVRTDLQCFGAQFRMAAGNELARNGRMEMALHP